MISKCQSKRTLLQRKYLESQGIPWLSCYSWEQRKLGEVGKARSGVGFPDTEQGGSSGTPFFKVSDMNNDGNENEMNVANNYVTDAQIAARRWSPIEEVPAIFFAKVGAAVMLNRKRLCRFPFLLDNNTMAYSLSKDQWDADFAKALFETVDLTTLVQVGALPSYNASDVEAMEIMLPEIPEQRQIGAYFRQLDNLITLHQCKYLMFPAFSQINKSLSDTLSWEQRKLGDLGSVSMCRRIFKHQTSESGEIPFFKIGTFGGEPDAFITRELFEEFKAKYPYPDKGDILISASGSIGRTVEFTGENEYFQDSNIVWLKHDKSIINPFLRHLYSVVEWAGIEGSTIKRLYNDNILKTEVMLPSVQEQTKIAEMLDGIDSLITLHQCKYLMFPAFSQINKSLSDTLSWEQRKLSDLVDVCSGRDYKHLSEGTIPVYGTGGYMLSVSEALSYDRDAIGIGRKGTIDKPYVLKAPFWTVDTLFYAVPKHPECLDFIHDIFQIIDWKKKDESTGVPSLSKEAINDTDVMVPKIDEQLITGDVFARIDNLITLHQC